MSIRTLTLAVSILSLAACGGGSGGDSNGSSSSVASSSSSSSSEASSSVSSAPLEVFDNPTLGAAEINYNDVPVHDPSVIRIDDGTFYVVGSHLGFAKSTDLISWEPVANGVDDANPLFNTYATEISEGIEWTGGYVGSWASDIIQLDDGRYYFYYNHCTQPATGQCDGPRSYLGVAVSDDVEGPYVDQGIFLYSGQTDEEMTGDYGVGDLTSFDAFVHPNVIDPTAFFDKDGQLWMSYGSYSGGIFVLAMDETTGKPEPGQGYGTHIIGGDHSSIEGSFVYYSPESDYYYLFTSFGGYEAADGYNIRVARSRNPDGPYLDAAGNDVANARGNWESIAPYGNKMMGGFIFQSLPGSDAESRGYLAPGHNSAYYDESTGQHFLITHTRFPGRGEGHAIRVHEMWVNNDGWLVASPQRYAPIEGENIVDYQDIVGDFQIIDHGKDINRSAHLSMAATLHEDGSISGEVNGSYTLYAEQPERITITLDDGTVFEGLAAWQWDPRLEVLVPTFTALSAQGASIWGLQLPAKTNGEVVDAITAALSLPTEFKGTALELPTEGARGASIGWSISDTSTIAQDGSVTRPNVGEGDAMVELTATISRQGIDSMQSFNVTVPQRVTYNRTAQYQFENDLTDSLGNKADGYATADRIHNAGSVAYAAGQSGQAVMLDGTNGVRLPDGLIDNYEYTVSMWVNPAMITQFSTAFFGAANELTNEEGGLLADQWLSLVPESWDNNTMLWSGSQAWVDASAGELISENSWTHLAFAVNQGTVSVYIDGVEKFSGGSITDFFTWNEGLFALGVNYWDLPFNGMIDELNIYDAALSAGEITALDIDQLPATALLESAKDLLDLGDLSGVQSDFELPSSGPYASAISWSSSNSSALNVQGNTAVVTRPESIDTDVTLTATLTLDGETSTKTFVVTVNSLAPAEPVAHFSFDDHLSDETANFGAGTVTGNLMTNTGGDVNYGAGKSGMALSLDGNSGVALPDGLIDGSRYSFALWLNPQALNQFTTAFFGAQSTSSWISVVPFGPGDGNTMLWSGEAWFDGDTGAQFAAGEWTHFATVVDAGNITLYVNGEQVFTGTGFPDVFTGADAEFGIGVNYWDTPYTGLVDELVIFDEAVSAEVIAALAE
ncbi:LamG-like jellyroll fold domain-containing protein [Gilvimarinus sp. SDUM040013]|uniref:LamG-like jellyroll fold domain-containing protein n=1 Tax=Gilvimarinus gilvus TaxID=3058038 RepID=A0ABU4S2R4_9GAMM|nr:LamG-like jellyroll fold domain-containing protein [Gilvimarinus sp. SDUM040013]MDO3384561.1 LamG-like jellyroll fold domain-containing protein [Gilvimarinus sp. SDUM040013]MDX6850103.1 LamG-like jellyroll fold domain-containing protein [Gilvimarinus sp. SDUM040013]